MKYTFEDVIAKKSECNWQDISKEKYRTYIYLRENNIATMRIENPIAIDLRKSGGHIVVCSDGTARYIKPGWDIIEWENEPDVSRARW